MVKYIFIILICLFSAGHAKNAEIFCGRIVNYSGKCLLNGTYISEEKTLYIKSKDLVSIAQNSSMDILLNDGTALRFHGPASAVIVHSKSGQGDLPTYIKIFYGRIKIIQRNSYLKHSLTVITKNSIIKSVNSSFDMVSSLKKDIILSRSGQFGIANIKEVLNTALIVKSGYLVTVDESAAPYITGYLERKNRKSWIFSHSISDNNEHITEYKTENGIVEWMLSPLK